MIASASSLLKKKSPNWELFCRAGEPIQSVLIGGMLPTAIHLTSPATSTNSFLGFATVYTGMGASRAFTSSFDMAMSNRAWGLLLLLLLLLPATVIDCRSKAVLVGVGLDGRESSWAKPPPLTAIIGAHGPL